MGIRRLVPVVGGLLVGAGSLLPVTFPTLTLFQTLVIAQASLLAIVISVAVMSLQVSTSPNGHPTAGPPVSGGECAESAGQTGDADGEIAGAIPDPLLDRGPSATDGGTDSQPRPLQNPGAIPERVIACVADALED